MAPRSIHLLICATIALAACSPPQQVAASSSLTRACGPTDAVGLQLVIPVAQGEIDLFAPGWPEEGGESFTMEEDHHHDGLVIALCQGQADQRRCTYATRGTLEIASQGAVFAGDVHADMPDGESIDVRFTATETVVDGGLMCG